MPQRVLLCDDEIHILRAVEFKMKRAGYDVITAGNGIEAWEAIQAQKPDILIVDYQMPQMDGLQLVERIRQTPETRDLPILMLTAKGFELDQEEIAAKWNVMRLLPKPFSPREVLAIVESIIGKPTDATQATADRC
jgi:CheY-like chemotaxis protein